MRRQILTRSQSKSKGAEGEGSREEPLTEPPSPGDRPSPTRRQRQQAGDEAGSSSESGMNASASNVATTSRESVGRSTALAAPKRVRSSRNKRSSSGLYDHFHALPDYLRDNEYIKRYYRRSMPVRDSILSLFGLHNETGNIYTHLIGFILFVCLTVYLAREPPTPLAIGSHQVDLLWQTAHEKVQQLRGSLGVSMLPSLHHLQGSLQQLQEGLSEQIHHLQEELSETVQHIHEGLSDGVHWLQEGMHLSPGLRPSPGPPLGAQAAAGVPEQADVHSHLVQALSGVLTWPTARWPTYVYMGGAMTCLLLSAVCHLLGCCQKHISQFVWRLDYAGIATLIVTSFYPPVYYGFMCHRVYLVFYLTTTTLLGAMAVMVSLLDRFQAREWRHLRAMMFSGLGLYGIAPVVHQWLLNNHVPQVRTALVYDLIMGATYLSGGAIYALRVPERWFPGKFDLFLHSHQVFHLAVVAGAYIHYYSVKLMLEWRDASGGCAAPVMAGPVSSVLQQMRDLGHDLFSIEEVWGRLGHYMQHYMQHQVSAGGEAAFA